MLALPPNVKIYMATEPVDMRKGFCGLSQNVCDISRQDPFTGHLNVFLKKETRPCESALLGEERLSLTLQAVMAGPISNAGS